MAPFLTCSLLYLYKDFFIHFTLFNPLMLVGSVRQEKCSQFMDRKPEAEWFGRMRSQLPLCCHALRSSVGTPPMVTYSV